MCTVGVYKCVCVCPMCVLSVAISNNVFCVVCGTKALFSCAQCTCVRFVSDVVATFLLCCFVVTSVLVSVVSCESRHIIVYCVRGSSSLTL